MGRQSRTIFTSRIITRCIASLFGLAVALPAVAADALHDTILVRFPDNVVAASAATPPAAELAKLARALDGGFHLAGRTRDGAFRLQLDQGLPPDQMRAVVNQIRLTANVLYANVESTPTMATPSGMPTDRLIVKYRDTGRVSAARGGTALGTADVARLSTLGGQTLAWVRNTSDGAHVLQMMSHLTPAEAAAVAASIAQQPDIEYAEPDAIWSIRMVPTDPCYASAGSGCGGYQWDLFDPVGGINAPAAWDITTGSSSIAVAVVDTGALPNHPDLAGRFLPGYDLIGDAQVGNDGDGRDSNASDPGDWISLSEDSYGYFIGCGTSGSSWHGTHVAGTIGAVPNNGAGIVGINWVSGIVPVRVLGKCGGYNSDINDGIVWAAGGTVAGVPANANPARVINVSLGGTGACPISTQASINTALGLGAVIAVAAGNSNANAANFSPASCSGVITVAATTKTGTRASYSNYGTVVDIAAPGGDAVGGGFNILSTLNNSTTSPNAAGYNYVNYAGTSMAAPHVTGVASLVLSANPALTPAQVIAKIQATARAFPAGSTCTTSLCGAGMIDAGAAVAAAVVVPVATTAAVVSSLNPATAGTGVTFTATVTGSAPTGSVAFKDNGASLSGCSAVALVGTGASKTAQCIAPSLAAGTHPVTVAYTGDTANLASTSTTLSQVITTAAMAATTTVVSSLNPATTGTSVTFTATVAGNAPTGNVAFNDNGAVLAGCGAVALVGVGANRTAQCVAPSLTLGTHPVTAVYAGDPSNLTASSAPLSQVVTVAATASATTLVSAQNPSVTGSSVALTATVTGNAPTGSVAFKDNGTALSGCAAVALVGIGASKTAQCATVGLATGTHPVTATYGGDAVNLTSTSASVAQVINAAGTSTTTTAATSLSPAIFGTGVTFSATVTGNLPTGRVAFKDDGVAISACGAVPLYGTGATKTATCVGALLPVGTHVITTVYAGDTVNLASTSAPVSQVINGVATTTAVISSLTPSVYATNLIFTATVVGKAVAGTVAFKDNGVVLSGCGTIALVGTSTTTKTAKCTALNMASGTHPITAAFAGGAGNLASVSSTLTQTVNRAATTTVMVSAKNPALAGAMVTYTAVVTGKTPSGKVAFTDNGVTIPACAAVALPGTNNARNATCNYATSVKGTHTIGGAYTGDSNNLTSSGVVAEKIN